VQRPVDPDSSAVHSPALDAVTQLASSGLDLIEPPSRAARSTAALPAATHSPTDGLSGSVDLGGVGSAGTPARAFEESINLSGGGPGTSTAKGAAATAKQVAKRAGSSVDRALGAVDLGIGEAARAGLIRVGAAAKSAGMPNLGRGLVRLGGAARWAAPALAVGGAVLPAVTGAMDGFNQAGVGGAAIQGGTGLAGAAIGGAIGSVIPGFGTVIGAGIGSMLGSGVGSALTSGVSGLVEKAQAGDTGWAGGIGRALDPFIDTAFEKQQQAALQQMNSPAMRMIRDQENARIAQARADQTHALLMQSYLQGLR
jgi:hypothetical protein